MSHPNLAPLQITSLQLAELFTSWSETDDLNFDSREGIIVALLSESPKSPTGLLKRLCSNVVVVWKSR